MEFPDSVINRDHENTIMEVTKELGKATKDTCGGCKMATEGDDDIESGRQARGECLDGSKTWHPICLRISGILFNLCYAILAIVALVGITVDREELEAQEGDTSFKLALSFCVLLLLATSMGVLASAIMDSRLLKAANVLYAIFLCVYVPMALGYSKQTIALLVVLLLLIPIFLQTKMLYLSREPPQNDQRVNPARAHYFSAPRTDFFDGSQQWHPVCLRTCAFLTNVAVLIVSIVLIVDLTDEYQQRESDYLTYYKYQTDPISFKLAYSLCGSLLFVSSKGVLGSLLLQRHFLITASIEYPLEVIFYVSVGTYFNLPRLLALGLALIVPPILLGKLYMMTFRAKDIDISITQPSPAQDHGARQSQPYPQLHESSRRQSIRGEVQSNNTSGKQPKRQSTNSMRSTISVMTSTPSQVELLLNPANTIAKSTSNASVKQSKRQSTTDTSKIKRNSTRQSARTTFDDDLPSPNSTKRPSQVKRNSKNNRTKT